MIKMIVNYDAEIGLSYSYKLIQVYYLVLLKHQ